MHQIRPATRGHNNIPPRADGPVRGGGLKGGSSLYTSTRTSTSTLPPRSPDGRSGAFASHQSGLTLGCSHASYVYVRDGTPPIPYADSSAQPRCCRCPTP
ncbi:unnamed protein product [Boreogadus saida]